MICNYFDCNREYYNLKYYFRAGIYLPMLNTIAIRAQITVFKNSLQINCKKKSKLSTITLDDKSKLLVVVGKGDNQTFKFPLDILKSIHKKFIDEGKITIQFDSALASKPKPLELQNENIVYDGITQVFITNGCKENLQILISQITNIKKKASESAKKPGNRMSEPSLEQKNRKKQCQQIKTGENQKPTRKSLFDLARTLTSNQGLTKQTKKIEQDCNLLKKKPATTLLTLPKILLRQILFYCGISLSYRLISKEFEELVLSNIKYIRIKDEVDQISFQKLAKWAITLQGRFKWVKALKLEDRFNDQILTKNRAKSLKFGNWKQLSSKHISQLKGLRIYSLEIPYSIKFDSSNLFGLRLVQLRLKGKDVNIKNSYVKDDDVIYLINNLKQLRVIEVAYVSSKIFTLIQTPSKMTEIKIGTLNKIPGFDDWNHFSKFENIRFLSIENIQKSGVSQDQTSVSYDITYPETLQFFEVGLNLSLISKSGIPTQLKYLKLIGTHNLNSDFCEYFLPSLDLLDITESPNLTPQCLENLKNLKVLTNWNRNQVQSASSYYSSSNIIIQSVRGYTYC